MTIPYYFFPAQVRNKAWFGICEAFKVFLTSWTVIKASIEHAAELLGKQARLGVGSA